MVSKVDGDSREDRELREDGASKEEECSREDKADGVVSNREDSGEVSNNPDNSKVVGEDNKVANKADGEANSKEEWEDSSREAGEVNKVDNKASKEVGEASSKAAGEASNLVNSKVDGEVNNPDSSKEVGANREASKVAGNDPVRNPLTFIFIINRSIFQGLSILKITSSLLFTGIFFNHRRHRISSDFMTNLTLLITLFFYFF